MEIAKAAVEEAHRHGMPVFAHPQNLDGVEIAISSGVDILAHTVPDLDALIDNLFIAPIRSEGAPPLLMIGSE